MRTWDDNRGAINGLWPMAEFTDEERRLWHDDLSQLNQDVLYDAIRNVKRKYESLYPQIKHVREEYRAIDRVRRLATRVVSNGDYREPVVIDKDTNDRIGQELRALVDSATPADIDGTVRIIADKASKLEIEMATAFSLVRYLHERLGNCNGIKFGGTAA